MSHLAMPDSKPLQAVNSSTRGDGPNELEARTRLARLIGGYCATQAIFVAAKLGMADRLQASPQTAQQLAQATGAHAHSLHRLLRTLAGFGLVVQHDGGHFSITDAGQLLRSDSPGSLHALAISVGELHYAPFGALLHSVMTGEPGFERVMGMSLFDYLEIHSESSVHFDAALAPLRSAMTAAVLGQCDFSDVRHVVDIGAGLGDFASALLAKYPSMHATLFDRTEVATRAESRFEASAMAKRCDCVGGDFFESVPTGGDAYLLRHILHDWNDDQAIRLLKNCRRAMNRGSRLVVIESVIRDDNEPSLGKNLDLIMLAVTGGRERTEPEYRTLLRASGFRMVRIAGTPAGIDVIEAIPVKLKRSTASTRRRRGYAGRETRR
jgi:hypothetical protein